MKQQTNLITVAGQFETGITGIYQLKRIWSKLISNSNDQFPDEQQLDYSIINLLGIGLLPLYQFVHSARPSFTEFEEWILMQHQHQLPESLLQKCNALVRNENLSSSFTGNVLSDEDIEHWNRHGYLILRNAVPAEDCAETCSLIWNFLGMKEDDPATWYKNHESIQGIMVTLYNHPCIIKNRQNAFIRKAYEQLWGTNNLIVTADKVGFNPPETKSYKYKGAGMHWDTSLATPIPYGTQGILYLTDTAENQGAFRLVPGFHLRIHDWLQQLPSTVNPRNEPIAVSEIKHIAANAGDFIIWHHALPHDGSPNTASKPRLVQYFNWFDPSVKQQEKWV